ncbi:aryl-sulfate sulfotransferase [Flagellimonas meridianipacifica]|uniref:Arylsulfate sulfotransferase n=1 Tax=Flagellimonas meridianipacifica TaxID=1080225 RepID=A0A2T0MHV3_9FLAO|nr:aryl-sulfate sulfotransferase [Allomuricauda pacifica]PRX57142.1 arylsulfate sulfotransferase [Allomuricauda pacifica]
MGLRNVGLLTLLFFLFYACSDDDTSGDTNPDLDSDVIRSINVRLNPTGYAPLNALIDLETLEAVSVEITVVGREGSTSNITRSFPGTATSFELEVFGLYANYNNTLELTLFDGSGVVLENREVTVETPPLIADMPQISIDVPTNTSELEFNLVNYFGFSQNFRPQRPFIFDQFGDIRWYLNFTSHPELSDLFFDNGMTQLRNGNFLFGNAATRSIYEIDLFGRIVDSWSLQGNGFHHHVIEKPDGNLLVTINDASKSTVEDVVIEIDRATGEFINTWDLNNSLDNSRRGWPTDLADLNEDWFHANALEYSAEDDEIIVSGRTQGVVKLNQQNEVSYILAPHRDWNTSGDGTDLAQFLLTPLDANDQPITDLDVLDGTVNHPDFEWSWYQHSPILMPNGNLMIFDNGDNRNYINAGPYSRAVEYEIDEQNKTIKQVWSYGKERGSETYARIVSKVSYLSDKNSVLFTPGSSVSGGVPAGKVIEVDYGTKSVLFEATINPPNTIFNISFHNVLRVSLLD